MHLILNMLMTALLAIDGVPAQGPAPQAGTRPGAPAANHGPMVAFEIRDIGVSSPEWRGKFIMRMRQVARQEGTAVWALDASSFKELLEHCQADTRTNVVQAPKMTARVGDPARMSSEETVQYVASFKRVADGPPNKSTRLAFEPQLDKVHSGVRVNIQSSQLKNQKLFAKLVIEENFLVAVHTVKYTETVLPKPGTDPEVMRTSLLERLSPNHGSHAAAINATIQVPEVDSRRVEGEWLIPSDGALLVSFGPRPVHEHGFLKGYREHLIAMTARPVTGSDQASPAQPSAAAIPVSSPTAQPTPTAIPSVLPTLPAISPSVPAPQPR